MVEEPVGADLQIAAELDLLQRRQSATQSPDVHVAACRGGGDAGVAVAEADEAGVLMVAAVAAGGTVRREPTTGITAGEHVLERNVRPRGAIPQILEPHVPGPGVDPVTLAEVAVAEAVTAFVNPLGPVVEIVDQAAARPQPEVVRVVAVALKRVFGAFVGIVVVPQGVGEGPVVLEALVAELGTQEIPTAVVIDRLAAVDIGVAGNRLAEQADHAEVVQLGVDLDRVERQVQRVAHTEEDFLPADANPQLVRVVRLAQPECPADVDLVQAPVEVAADPILMATVLIAGVEVFERQPHAGEDLVDAPVHAQARPERQPGALIDPLRLDTIVEVEQVVLEPAAPLPVQQRVQRGQLLALLLEFVVDQALLLEQALAGGALLRLCVEVPRSAEREQQSSNNRNFETGAIRSVHGRQAPLQVTGAFRSVADRAAIPRRAWSDSAM